MDPAQQVALVKALDHSYLVVQGPPGSGKTYLAGRLISALLRDGYRVGVSSLSHKAINHVLTSVERELGGHMPMPVGLKKATSESDQYAGSLVRNTFAIAECDGADVALMAGTGWVFCRESMTARFDYLFIDEAGQLALADVVAMSGAARNVVLLGDPQQLPHIQQGIHPEY
jgi:uncharacterized protein